MSSWGGDRKRELPGDDFFKPIESGIAHYDLISSKLFPYWSVFKEATLGVMASTYELG